MEKYNKIKSSQQIRTEQQFLYLLAQIIEAFPQYSIAQHLTHMLRKKNDIQDVYFWSQDTILKKIEQYYDELKELSLEEIED